MVDFEALKPENIVRLFDDEFRFSKLYAGLKNEFLSEDENDGDDEEDKRDLSEHEKRILAELQSQADICSKKTEFSSGQIVAGIESTSPIVNLLVPIFVLLCFAFCILLAFIFGIVCCVYRKATQEKLKKLKKKTIWNGIIRAFSIAFLNICFAM